MRKFIYCFFVCLVAIGPVLFLDRGVSEAATSSDRKGMLPLESAAPVFNLKDVISGKDISIEYFSDKKALLVVFMCRHCPYVKHILSGLSELYRDYSDKSFAMVGISSNDATAYPQDSPGSLKEMALEAGLGFPVCYDEDQSVAKKYTGVCTPDFFLFDESRKLVYRGQFDESRPGNKKPVTGKDVRAAIDAVLRGEAVSGKQKPSFGCSIKWKAGNEPEYSK